MGAPYHMPSRAFIDFMTPHHEMAIMMSKHAVTAATSAEVRALAQRMVEAQQREVAELKALRKSLYGSDSTRHPMPAMMQQMMAMHRMGDTLAMRTAMDSMHARMHPGDTLAHHRNMAATMMRGDFDRMFLERMIGHHQDGVDVSVLAEDSQAADSVKRLARKIREGQERDIADMRRLLGQAGHH